MLHLTKTEDVDLQLVLGKVYSKKVMVKWSVACFCFRMALLRQLSNSS
jgi:hypothetical protein